MDLCGKNSFPEDFERTRGKFLQVIVLDASVNFDEVLLFVHVPGMHEVVREPSIVREQEKSRGILVETTDRKYPLPDVDDIHDTGVLVARTGCDDTSGLVNLVVHEIFRFRNRLVTDYDLVDRRIDHLSDSRDFAIDGYEPSGNEFLGLATRSYARLGEVFVNSEWSCFHMDLFNDSYFFVEFDAELVTDFGFGEFRKLENVLPDGTRRADEEVRVMGRYLHPADFYPLEPHLVDDLASTRSGRIFEIRSARESGWLFGSPRGLHLSDIHFGEWVFELPVFQTEGRTEYDMSILSFQCRRTIYVFHLVF